MLCQIPAPVNTSDSVKVSGALTDQAYAVIRERILSGIYSFGTVISRRELAAELGMSQVPVNEALARLEDDYLIENTARVQTRVRVPTPLDIRGFWAVREALETQSARLFTKAASRKERTDLLNAARELDQLHGVVTEPEMPDAEALYQWRCAHMSFHVQIAAATRLPFLVQAIERNQLLVFNWFYDHKLYGGPALPARWHEQLAQALTEQSEQEAESAMRIHILNRFDELMLRLEAVLTINESHIAEIASAYQAASTKADHLQKKPLRRRR